MSLLDARKAVYDARQREIVSLLRKGPQTAEGISEYFVMGDEETVERLSALVEAGMAKTSTDDASGLVTYQLDQSAFVPIIIALVVIVVVLLMIGSCNPSGGRTVGIAPFVPPILTSLVP